MPVSEATVPNDPSRPRIRGISIEKQLERFKYEPEEPPNQTDELVIPADVKKLREPKNTVNMAKGPERFPSRERIPNNFDLSDLAS